jgi:hypothetical protein
VIIIKELRERERERVRREEGLKLTWKALIISSSGFLSEYLSVTRQED